MNTSAVMKKRTSVFFISLVFIIVALAVTYIIFGRNSFNDDVLINNKNIKVIFENSEKGIQFGGYPMSFQQGLLDSPSNMYKIVNKTEFSTKYQVMIRDTSKDANKIDINKLVVGINDVLVKPLSECPDGLIYEGVLEPKYQDILDLKFWIDESLYNESDKSKTLGITVDIKEK